MKKSLLNKVKNSGLECVQAGKNTVRVLLPIEGANHNSKHHIEIWNNKQVHVFYAMGLYVDIFEGRNAYIIVKRFLRAGKSILKDKKTDHS